MLILILSLSQLCWGQNQQIPTANLQSPQAQQAVQNVINNKFSVFGGTVTGNVNITGTLTSTGTVTSTGKSYGGSDYCFHDGTCQNTAAVAQTGITMTRIASGTISGVNASTITFSFSNNTTYLIIFTSTASTTLDYYLSLNGEGNGTMNHVYVARDENTAGNNAYHSTGDQGWELDNPANHVIASSVFTSHIFVNSGNSDGSASIRWQADLFNSVSATPEFAYEHGAGIYRKIAAITSISFRATAGTMTGAYDILELD